MSVKYTIAAAMICMTGSAMGDVVQRVWWNPRISHNGANDPFMGQSTDETLAMPGDLTASGYSRFGNNGTIGFSNVPTAFDENTYIEFSIIPGQGQELEVHDLILQGGVNGAPMPLDRIVLRTELDGFTTDFAALAGPTNLQGNSGRPIRFELESLPAFDEELTFRLYVWNVSSFGIVGSLATNGHGMWFGDIDANPVPAPASLAIVGLGGLCAVRRRR